MRTTGSWQRYSYLSFLLAASLWGLPLTGFCAPAAGQEASAAIDAAAVVHCLEQNKFLHMVGKAQAVVDGPRLLIALYQDPRANIRDLKINSVLLAKGLADQFGASFDQYIFSHFPLAEQSLYCQATLSRGDLELFAQGKLSNDQLLSRVKVEPFLAASLKRRYQGLSYAEIICEERVVESYDDNRNRDRKEIKARILSLKRSGYDVSVAERQFLKIEDFVRRHENFDQSDYAAAWHAIELCLQESVNNGTLRKVKIASDEGSSWQR